MAQAFCFVSTGKPRKRMTITLFLPCGLRYLTDNAGDMQAMAMEKTFDAKTAEPRIYKMWEEAGAFRAGANATRDETFTIMLPPPNVTGHLHVGHAFSQTLMDILTLSLIHI